MVISRVWRCHRPAQRSAFVSQRRPSREHTRLRERWGFLLALVASVPYVYTAIPIFIWDRDLGFGKNTITYWVFIWAMFPAYGIVEAVYSFARLVE